jgi:branched-chain amino acid transport system substrate-binding protein
MRLSIEPQGGVFLRSRLYVTLVTLASPAVLATGCGSDSGGGSTGGTVSGSSLTIYSSLPLQGASRGQSEAVITGEKLALQQVAPGNKVGKYSIKYVSLDDSTAQNPGTADEGQTAQNARKAVQDKTTIAYLGEFNSSGTTVSLPTLNQAGIPQLSPSNTYVGLTTNDPGSEPGEPQKYYPAQTRTYARVVPRDTIQGAALVSVMKSDGCKAVTLWDDKTTYGAGVARNIELSAKQGGLPVQDRQSTDKTAPNYRSLAANVKTDCFAWTGVTAENGAQVFKDVAAATPKAKLYGPDGVTSDTFTDPKKGGIPANVGARTQITVSTLGVNDLPSARKVVDALKKQSGGAAPDPYSIYGYETMALALDAIKRAGAKGNDRKAVLDQIFATKDRKSVLGTYSIDKNGDTTLTNYGLYMIKDGTLTYDRKITSDPALIPKG